MLQTAVAPGDCRWADVNQPVWPEAIRPWQGAAALGLSRQPQQPPQPPWQEDTLELPMASCLVRYMGRVAAMRSPTA